MSLIQTIVTARDFAVRAHGSQKYGDEPYSAHLDEVAELALHSALQMNLASVVARPANGVAELALHSALQMGLDMTVVCSIVSIAYVHDVLEDTVVTASEIEKKFGKPVANCAIALSDPPGKNRKERKAALHARLSLLDLSSFGGCAVLLVKACDRLANLRRSVGLDGGPGNPGLLKMYREEAEAFRQAAWRPGVCDRVWQEIDQICPVHPV